MKLRNKKTGEIVETYPDRFDMNSGEQIMYYNSLAELNEEWEDYEEPKEYWYIEPDGSIIQNHKPTYINHLLDGLKSIANYFESKEEAEQTVEKLKAWKRLKDKGFRFHEWYKPDGCEYFIVVETNIDLDDVDNMKLQKDLDLLFGGEK